VPTQLATRRPIYAGTTAKVAQAIGDLLASGLASDAHWKCDDQGGYGSFVVDGTEYRLHLHVRTIEETGR
jgi:hypothetical protein